MQNVGVQHEGPQTHLGLELQPNSMAHDPNPFIRGRALGPLGPYAQASCQPKAYWANNLNLYASCFITWALPGQLYPGQEIDCLGVPPLDCPAVPWGVLLPSKSSEMGSSSNATPPTPT